MTYKLKVIISQKLSQKSESPELHIRLLSLGIWQWEEEIPENLAFKVSGVGLQEFHRTERKRNSILGGCTQGLVCLRTGRKTVIS